MNNLSFKQYLVEAEKQIYFTFGRFNPPTTGHGKVIDKLASVAGRNPYKVFLAQSQDSKKNPLSYSDKIKYARQVFTKHGRNIIINKKIKTVFDAIASLYDEGYNKVTMVVGSDRITEFEVLLNKYNGVKSKHGFYNFESISVVSAGHRDPDGEGVEGMSASKMRTAASTNDFVAFAQGLPKQVSNGNAKKIFNSVRSGMGLKEEKDFKTHIKLEKVSEAREQYIRGNLFDLGDTVRVKKTGQEGTISWLGANYLVLDLGEGKNSRQWIQSVEKFKAEPKQTVSRVESLKSKRSKFKLMFDEEGEVEKNAKLRIKKEKETDALKHDRVLDRARRADVAKKNAKK
jgi:hypothetical protein|tara:strand:- start:1159 stop:2190 length:1032 start_codon:yes stop_codon:yes gene_type:complete